MGLGILVDQEEESHQVRQGEESGNWGGSLQVEGTAVHSEGLEEERHLAGMEGRACHGHREAGYHQALAEEHRAYQTAEGAFLLSSKYGNAVGAQWFTTYLEILEVVEGNREQHVVAWDSLGPLLHTKR